MKITNPAAIAQAIIDTQYWITPERFGAKRDGTTDDSIAMQAAIDAASSTGAPLWLGAGIYVVSGLVLKNGVRMMGCGRKSRLLAKSGDTTPLMTQAVGQVQGVVLRDFDVYGRGAGPNPAQKGLFLESVMLAATGNGGLWTFHIENMEFRFFDGDSLSILGGTDLLSPVQWGRICKVQIERAAATSGNAFRFSGQVEQVTIDACRGDAPQGTFDFTGVSVDNNGTNWLFSRRFDQAGPPDVFPDGIKVINCIAQFATQAFDVDRAENIDFDTCRVERCANGIQFRNSARGSLRNCRFSNAAQKASTGTIINSLSAARVSVGEGNYANGSNTRDMSTDGSGSIYLGAPWIGNNAGFNNVTPAITIGAGTTVLSTGNAQAVNLQANVAGVTLNALSNTIPNGAEFMLQITGSNSITITNVGGSFPTRVKFPSGATSVIMAVGEFHVFRRTSFTDGWVYKGKL